jgi:hypothetical protein
MIGVLTKYQKKTKIRIILSKFLEDIILNLAHIHSFYEIKTWIHLTKTIFQNLHMFENFLCSKLLFYLA